VETARHVAGGPIDFYAASGHGRSLSLYTCVLGRGLCGLLESGVWQALRAAPPAAASFALVTDIGNDLVYGVPPPVVGQWVEECLERCQSVAQKIIVTELPLASIARLGPRRYAVVRRMLFPRCALSLDEIARRARELNESIRAAAARRGATLVAHDGAWYGFDPIHIRRRAMSAAWPAILQPLAHNGSALPQATGSLHRWLYLHALAPEKRDFFGKSRYRAQPCGKLADGSTIALF
jgi:hypothetical protein